MKRLLPVLGFLLLSLPAFLYNAPVLQTDGIAYYGFAKTWAETNDFSADVPAYYQFASVQERKIAQYPPLVTILLGILVRTGHDVMWLNGIFCGLLFAMALWFLMLLAEHFKINPLIALPLAILNVRPYFTAWVGSLTAFAGFAFSVPAIYFFIRYLDKKKLQSALYSLFFLALTGLSYVQYLMYVMTLFILFFAAWLLNQHLTLSWPRIRSKTKKINWKPAWIIGVAAVLTGIILKMFMFAASGRKGYVQDYVHYLLTNNVGYPKIWELPLMTDSVFLVLLAVGGLGYAMYKQRWYLVSLGIAIIGGLLAGSALGLTHAWIYTYVLRFFILNAWFMALLAAFFVSALWKYRLTKAVFGLTLTVQFIMLAAFMGMVQPAITQEEMAVAGMIRSEQPLLFVENVEFGNSFKEPAWIIALAKPQQFTTVFDVPDYLPPGQVLIEDYTKLTPAQNKLVGWRKPIYKGEKVWLVE